LSPELLFLASVLVLSSAALGTYLVRKLALSHGMLDIPNARSSHIQPTPRGGGLAIVVSSIAAFVLLNYFGRIDLGLLLALIGGIPVAVVGFIDDRWSLPAGVRLIAHFGAALWAIAWLGGVPPLRVGEHLLSLGPAGYLLGALGIVWVLNLFNFMDGIDGIAASEGIFIAWVGALLQFLGGGDGAVPAAAMCLGAACSGFLLWNWPPAKIFMGDVGSGYLGYLIGVLALAAARQLPAGVWVWLILGGVFFVDATVTLLRRMARGEKVYQAHRSHAYQSLARYWRSHRRVTLFVMAVNLLWLLPCALFAALNPSRAAWTVLFALSPLVVAAIAAGAGRQENT
jgi:glycosyltransferase WbpL